LANPGIIDDEDELTVKPKDNNKINYRGYRSGRRKNKFVVKSNVDHLNLFAGPTLGIYCYYYYLL
jgi:hypothetical protein